MRYLLVVIGLAVLVVLVAMYAPVKDGQPLLRPEQLQQLVPGAESVPESTLLPAPAEIYRWRDASGAWQFGQVPPPGVQAELVQQKQIQIIESERFRQGALPEESK